MNTSDNKKQLMTDLKAVIRDAEVLMKSAGLPYGDEFKSAKERFETTLNNAKNEIIRLEKMVVDKTREAATTTDNYVKGHPWQAVGLSAAVGLIIGMLIRKK